jgi:hypothetical protein
VIPKVGESLTTHSLPSSGWIVGEPTTYAGLGGSSRTTSMRVGVNCSGTPTPLADGILPYYHLFFFFFLLRDMFFFFYKKKYIYKSAKNAVLAHRKYTKDHLRRVREMYKEITKA